MILFLDTETTGLINFSLPVDHPSQPHIVQLGAVLCDDDAHCTIQETYQAIIRPDGWEVGSGAEAQHGISTEKAYTFGEPLDDVFRRFFSLVEEADDADLGEGRLVGHNVQFDTRMVMRDFLTLPVAHWTPLNNLRPFCTMRAMTPICRLSHPRYRHTFKWPRLPEAYTYCFEREMETQHDALEDCRATRDIFVEGRRRGWWS